MSLLPKYCYDPKCEDLATHFLAESEGEDVPEDAMRKLSQVFQDAAEEFFTSAVS